MLLVALLVIWPGLGRGQPAPGVDVLAEPATAVTLAVGEGRLLRFAGSVDNVFIANPEVADLQPVSGSVVYVFGVAAGRTDLYGLDAQDQVVAGVDIEITPDLTTARRSLRGLDPTSRVTLDAAGPLVDSRGSVATVDDAIDVGRAIDAAVGPDGLPGNDRTGFAGGNQINLRVRFAEVARNDLVRLGVNWSVLGDFGDFGLGLATGLFVPAGAAAVGGAAETFGRATGSLSIGGADIDALLDALEREGLVTVLAEPNLTAVSGEPASFLAGGEFPIPVPQDDGGITVEFRTFGVALDFLPTLLTEDRIGIRVRPEVSSLSNDGAVEIDGFSIPSLTVRRAETTVEVASGQSFAIAGLFRRDVSETIDQVPGLGDLPVLGGLFRSTRFQREETELVILITPFVVEPSSDQDFVLPEATGSGGTVGERAALSTPPNAVDAPVGRAGFIVP